MSTAKFSRDDLERTARERFGWDGLQGGQIEAVKALLSGRDVLAVMATGYGKSAIYQLAGALLGGVTVVVSPLIALQTDQVAGLAELPNAPAAVAINSSLRAAAVDAAWERVSGADGGIVYLAPEQLAKDETVERLRDLGVTLFAVDEAHCVTAWGHDFRPDYLRLGDVIERLGHPRTVALTATGSSPVRRDIAERLRLRDVLELTRGFDRPNLWLEITRHIEESQKERAVIEQVVELAKPGLLYVATRRDTERYAAALAENGLRAAAYHGGLRAADRRAVHDDFTADRVDVVVATSAFGMGIDKPNVRFVVHAAVPESVDEYYQEIGRAGRDGEPAAAKLHYRTEDLGLRKFFASRKPDEEALRRVYKFIARAENPVKIAQLVQELELSSRSATGLVNALADAGVVRTDRRGSRATSTARAKKAAAAAVKVIEERERIEESRLEMMRGYAETTDCRRIFLLGYFGEQRLEPCGNCDVCRRSGDDAGDNAAEPLNAASGSPFAPQSSVVHKEWGPGTVMRVEDDRLTVFFEHEGYKVVSLELVTEHKLLQSA